MAEKKNKRRNRVPISCTICRRRKVKCDKKRPVCTACNRTGVAHLCHYIDPPWAQPLQNNEKEPESEVDVLKEKIRQLESQLYLQNQLPSPNEESDENSQSSHDHSIDFSPNEPLNLGKKFDMLHIKSTTTVHLGATSWLAIMKGDPYLRVLWAHIFKMRKKVEMMKLKFKMDQVQQDQEQVRSENKEKKSKCPVSVNHEPFVDSKESCPMSSNQCPVSHVRSSLKPTEQQQSEENQQSEEQETKNQEEKVCPLMIGDSSFLNDLTDHNCPIDHKKRKRTNSKTDNTTTPPKRKMSKADEKKASIAYQQNPVFMLESYLPKKKTLWLHIKRFFEVLYVYMPYVDEVSFIEELKAIFGEEDDEDQIIKVKIKSGVDFALVGTVCLLLRLSWHTLPMNNSAKLLKKSTNLKTYQEDPETIAYLQAPENEIKLKLVDCVKQCFSNLKLMRKSSLKIVQCGLYMRLYFMYSPDDGDGADGADSQIFLGMIIQMAISIGLHRDPKNFENFSNERQRHLWRKIWFKLVSLDVLQSMNLGCPRALQNHTEFSDTMLPCDLEDGATLEEFKSDLKELTIIKNIHTQVKIDDLIAKTMKVLLNSNKPARRYQVDNLIDQLEQCINGFEIINDKYALPQIGKILINRSKNEPLYVSGVRAIEFQLHVTVNMLLYLLNYILYVHFEPRGSNNPQVAKLAKNYAQKALNCALEGYRNCTLFFDCGLEYFGPGADIVLAPLLLLVGHRSMQFMVSLILRSRCGPLMKPNVVKTEEDLLRPVTEMGKDEFDHIDNRNHDLDGVEIKDETNEFNSFNVDVNSGELLATILIKHMESFHKLADLLGKKYKYSWRMGKAVGFFVTLLRKPVNIVKDLVNTDNVKQVEQGGKIADVLNSVPLVLSTMEEKMNVTTNLNTNSNTNTNTTPATSTTNYKKNDEFENQTQFPTFQNEPLFNPLFDLPSNLTQPLFQDQQDMFTSQPYNPDFELEGLMPDIDVLQGGGGSIIDNFMAGDEKAGDIGAFSNSWFS